MEVTRINLRHRGMNGASGERSGVAPEMAEEDRHLRVEEREVPAWSIPT